jgi:hypothetical protein
VGIASLHLTTGNKQLAVTFCPAEANNSIDCRDWQGHLIADQRLRTGGICPAISVLTPRLALL